MIEAVIAAFLLFSTLAGIQGIEGHVSRDSNDDVQQMATDLRYILEHGENRPGHPGLAQTLSAQSAWTEQSSRLESDLRDRLPAGYRVYLQTPYGNIGDCPPDLATMSVRPFLAYRQETGEIIECGIVVWRP
jgi:hypothetical protein